MLLKIGILIFIIFTIQGVLSLFTNKSDDDKIREWDSIVTNIGGREAVYFTLIFSLLYTIFFIVLYYNIGQINETMMWLSAIQIISAIVNMVKGVNNIMSIMVNGIVKKDNMILKILILGFDIFYICLAIKYMYMI